MDEAQVFPVLIRFIYIDGCQIHYTARFPDGTVFDSSYKRGRPLTMRIGAGKVRGAFAHCKTQCSLLPACRVFLRADCDRRFGLKSHFRSQILRGLQQGIGGGGGVPPMLVGTVTLQKLSV
jgi:peptidylprolyl isomerase